MIPSLVLAALVPITLISYGTAAGEQAAVQENPNANAELRNLQHAILQGYLSKLNAGDEDGETFLCYTSIT